MSRFAILPALAAASAAVSPDDAPKLTLGNFEKKTKDCAVCIKFTFPQQDGDLESMWPDLVSKFRGVKGKKLFDVNCNSQDRKERLVCREYGPGHKKTSIMCGDPFELKEIKVPYDSDKFLSLESELVDKLGIKCGPSNPDFCNPRKKNVIIQAAAGAKDRDECEDQLFTAIDQKRKIDVDIKWIRRRQRDLEKQMEECEGQIQKYLSEDEDVVSKIGALRLALAKTDPATLGRDQLRKGSLPDEKVTNLDDAEDAVDDDL